MTRTLDALLGIKDLIHLHPQALITHLGAILEASLELLTDDEVSVRRSLHVLYTEILGTSILTEVRQLMSTA
jgi:hypothetical protein